MFVTSQRTYYSKEGLWYIWVYVLETDTVRAEDFTATISIRSADGLDELSCRCRPLGLDLTKDKIADSGRGLVFTDKTARWVDNLMMSLISMMTFLDSTGKTTKLDTKL